MEAQQTPELLAQQLWDIEQIKQLKARYFRFLDTRNWDGFADLFTEDCKHYGYFADDPSRTLVGLAEYLPFLKAVVTPGRSVHHGHMPEITLTSPTEATGIGNVRPCRIAARKRSGQHRRLRPLSRDVPEVCGRQMAYQLQAPRPALGEFAVDARLTRLGYPRFVRVGFVGLGAMGSPMAERLLDAQLTLDVYARRSEVAERFVTLGAHRADSLPDMAARAD